MTENKIMFTYPVMACCSAFAKGFAGLTYFVIFLVRQFSPHLFIYFEIMAREILMSRAGVKLAGNLACARRSPKMATAGHGNVEG